MKKRIYSLYDRKIQAFMDPMTATHEGTILRSLSYALDDQANQSDIARSPEDFDLYFLGTMDQETGILMPPEKGQSHFIINAKTLKGLKNERNTEQA